MQETRGEIYTLPSSKGIWLDNIIKRMSSLYCTFEEKTDTLPNGINLSYKNISGEQIGPEISSFIMRSYIIKKVLTVNIDGKKTFYLSPVNIVIDSIDRSYTKLINKKAVDNIKIILNNHHFKQCKNVDDIKEWIHLVKDLNLRFLNL